MITFLKTRTVGTFLGPCLIRIEKVASPAHFLTRNYESKQRKFKVRESNNKFRIQNSVVCMYLNIESNFVKITLRCEDFTSFNCFFWQKVTSRWKMLKCIVPAKLFTVCNGFKLFEITFGLFLFYHTISQFFFRWFLFWTDGKTDTIWAFHPIFRFSFWLTKVTKNKNIT